VGFNKRKFRGGESAPPPAEGEAYSVPLAVACTKGYVALVRLTFMCRLLPPFSGREEGDARPASAARG
jgi:hypothetical protein